LVHPEFQISIPNLNYKGANDLPSFDSKLSIDLSQKLETEISIDDLDFVVLNDKLIEKYIKNEKNN
jgi:hypothetical protein